MRGMSRKSTIDVCQMRGVSRKSKVGSSFSGFLDLTVASSWRDKCFLEPLSSAEDPMLAFKLEWE